MNKKVRGLQLAVGCIIGIFWLVAMIPIWITLLPRILEYYFPLKDYPSSQLVVLQRFGIVLLFVALLLLGCLMAFAVLLILIAAVFKRWLNQEEMDFVFKNYCDLPCFGRIVRRTITRIAKDNSNV